MLCYETLNNSVRVKTYQLTTKQLTMNVGKNGLRDYHETSWIKFKEIVPNWKKKKSLYNRNYPFYFVSINCSALNSVVKPITKKPKQIKNGTNPTKRKLLIMVFPEYE